jgi:FXSXX-COOH protein
LERIIVSSPDNRPEEVATAVPRVAEVPLKRLVNGTGTALNNAVRRVLEDTGRGDQNYAAHGSSPVTRQGVGKS